MVVKVKIELSLERELDFQGPGTQKSSYFLEFLITVLGNAPRAYFLLFFVDCGLILEAIWGARGATFRTFVFYYFSGTDFNPNLGKPGPTPGPTWGRPSSKLEPTPPPPDL